MSRLAIIIIILAFITGGSVAWIVHGKDDYILTRKDFIPYEEIRKIPKPLWEAYAICRVYVSEGASWRNLDISIQDQKKMCLEYSQEKAATDSL